MGNVSSSVRALLPILPSGVVLPPLSMSFLCGFFFVAAEALRSHRGETHRLCAHEARKTHQTTNVSFLFLFQLEELEDTDHSILSSAHTAVEEK